MRKRFTATMTALILSLSWTSVSASENGKLYDLPTPSSTRTIATAQDLINLRESIKIDPSCSVNGVYELTADIDLGGIEWEPIGYNSDYDPDIAVAFGNTYKDVYEYAFSGTFNGNGHTISNFKITDPSLKYAGLFGALNGAQINDLNISDAQIQIDARTDFSSGAFSYNGSTLSIDAIDGVDAVDIYCICDRGNGVGYYEYRQAEALPFEDRVILDNGTSVYVYESSQTESTTTTEPNPTLPPDDTSPLFDVYTVDNDMVESAGVLCAYANNSQINNCSVSGDIDVYSGRTTKWAVSEERALDAGMLCGAVSCSTIDNTVTKGDIKVETPFRTAVGGVVGNLLNGAVASGSEITGCTSSVNSAADSLGISYAGGIVGRCNHNDSYYALIEDCEYTDGSEINMNADWFKEGESMAYSADSDIYNGLAGGICGINGADTKSCRVGSASIVLNTSGGASVGGIAGLNYKNIEDCISKAAVSLTTLSTKSSIVGGVVGQNGSTYLGDSDDACAAYDLETTVSGCTYEKTSGDVSVSVNSAGSNCIGYIAGASVAPATILDCTVNADDMRFVSSKSTYAGGVVGRMYSGTVGRCVVNGSIKNTTSGGAYCGGVTGTTSEQAYTQFTDETKTETVVHNLGASIYDCVNNADIDISASKAAYIGGFVGYLNSASVFDDHQSHIETSVTTGDIKLTPGSSSFVGGAVGYLVDSQVDDCRASGDVFVANTTKTVYEGGFVSRIKQASTDVSDVLAKVTNCLYSGSVTKGEATSKVKLGQFAYELSDNSGQLSSGGIDREPTAPLMNNCCYYYDGDEPENMLGTGLDADERLDVSNYNTWEFDTQWDVQSQGSHKDKWYMGDDGAYLVLEKPGAYECETETENGIDVRITSVTVSYPRSVTSLKAKITDILGDVTWNDIDLSAMTGSRFAVVPCDIELDALTQTYELVTEYDGSAENFEASLTSADGSLTAVVKNNTDSSVPTSADAYIAEYDDNGILTAFGKLSVDPGNTEDYTEEVKGSTAKLFVWQENQMVPLINAVEITN